MTASKLEAGADDVPPTQVSMQNALIAAEAALAGGSPGACLMLLAALPPGQRQQLPVRQLQALCQIQLAGRPCVSQAWWKVFGLDAASASSADVRRQFKRLAALVHPDKCSASAAADGFRNLRAAADSLLLEAEGKRDGMAGDPGSRVSKRVRADSSGASGRESAAEGADVARELGGQEDDGWVPDGGGFPWWEEWDSGGPRRGAAAAATAAGTAEGRADREQWAAAVAAAESAQEGQGQQACGTDGEQGEAADELQAMPLDALRAEVRRRQAAVLMPPLDASGQRVPVKQLQAELRRARTVLAERVAAEAAAAALANSGGFLP